MIENETKCFAKVNGKCILLISRKCNGYDECPFYKTEEQTEADRTKAFERIATLPIEQQECISYKYYSDRMPWHVKG